MRHGLSRPFLLAVLLLGILGAPAAAQAPEGAILLIMDSSGSMDATDADGVPLIDGAKDALRGVVDSLPDGTHVGLRVYGHREPNTDEERGCRDTELISPVQALDRDALHEAIDGFEPSGFTPIGASLEAAADDLPPEGPRTIILVSDGEDTCAPPDPCEVAADLRGDGVDLVVETVGFALGSDEAAREQLECIAEAGGGQFTDVATAAELVEELEVVSTREARRFQTDGAEVEAGTSPRDAPTIDLGQQYRSDLRAEEQHFYRYEVPAGATVDVEATRAPVPGARVSGVSHVRFGVEVVDRDGNQIACHCPGWNPEYGLHDLAEVQLRAIRGLDLEGAEEIYVVISDLGHWTHDIELVEYDFSVTVVDAPEAEPEPEETEEPEEPEVEEAAEEPEDELAAEPAASGGLPSWAAVVMTLLVVLVLALGAAVAVLFRRTSAPAGSPPGGSPPPPPT